jgi:hypothetical protein
LCTLGDAVILTGAATTADVLGAPLEMGTELVLLVPVAGLTGSVAPPAPRLPPELDVQAETSRVRPTTGATHSRIADRDAWCENNWYRQSSPPTSRMFRRSNPSIVSYATSLARQARVTKASQLLDARDRSEVALIAYPEFA